MSKAAELPAGRELDLLVHRALGLEPTKRVMLRAPGREELGWESGALAQAQSAADMLGLSQYLTTEDSCPPYSSDPAAALEALARCIGTLYSPGAEQDGRKEWAAWAHMGAWGYGETPALAIARAVAAAGER